MNSVSNLDCCASESTLIRRHENFVGIWMRQLLPTFFEIGAQKQVFKDYFVKQKEMAHVYM
jgi:hypothetical protein